MVPSVLLPGAPTANVVIAALHAKARKHGQTPGVAKGTSTETVATPLLRTAAAPTHPIVEPTQVAEAHEGAFDVVAGRTAAEAEGEETGAGLVPAKVGPVAVRAGRVVRAAEPAEATTVA